MGVPSYAQREHLAMDVVKSANVEKIVIATRSTVNASANLAILVTAAKAAVSRDGLVQNVVNYATALTVQLVTNEMVHAFALQDSLAQNVTLHVRLEDMETIARTCVHVKMVVRVIVCRVIANVHQDSQD